MRTLYTTLIMMMSMTLFINAQNTSSDNLTKIMFEAKVTKLQEQTIEMATMEDADMKQKLQVKTTQSTEELYKKLAKQVAATFSESEITYLIDFYKSPVGKKLLESSDAFNELTTSTIQDWQFALDEIIMNVN